MALPTPPILPGWSDLTVQAPVFITTDPGPAPGVATVTIPSPPDITLVDMAVTVPRPSWSIPATSVSWAYAEYTNLALAMARQQAEYLGDAGDSSWNFSEGAGAALWQDTPTLAERMGWTPVNARQYAAEIAYGRQLFAGGLRALREAQATKSARSYFTILLQMERQQQQQFSSRKDLELKFAQDVVEKSYQGYNLAVQQYLSMIEAYRADSAKYQALVQDAANRTRQAEAQIKAAQAQGEVATTLIKRYQAQLVVNGELLKRYELQMTAAKKQVDALGLILARYKTIVDNFSAGIEQLTIEANQAGIMADIDTIRAKIKMAATWPLELQELLTVPEAQLALSQQERNLEIAVGSQQEYSLYVHRSTMQKEWLNDISRITLRDIESTSSAEAREARASSDMDMSSQKVNDARVRAEARKRLSEAEVSALVEQLYSDCHARIREIEVESSVFRAREQAAKIMRESNTTHYSTENITRG